MTLADQIKEIVYFVRRYGVQSLIVFGVGLHLYEIFGLGEFKWMDNPPSTMGHYPLSVLSGNVILV